MNFDLQTFAPEDIASWSPDALVWVWPMQEAAPGSAAIDGAATLTAWAQAAVKAGDLDPAQHPVLSTYGLPGMAARTVVVVRPETATAAAMRKALAQAMLSIKGRPVRHLGLWLPHASPQAVQAAVLALADSTYVYTTTKPGAKPRRLDKVTLAVAHADAVRGAFDAAVAMVKGVEVAKEWANRPGNHATPTALAKAARQLAKQPRVSVEVLGPAEVARLGMGAFMSVAQGSAEPLRFIILRYMGGAKSQAPVVLVGKGITFDTGGVSLKPAADMDEMKFDMGGAASVLGTFAALAELQPAINVIGLIPACENMPDGKAIKPGDVVTSMSGQTIEVLNTDAEGRLILCDALTYAERFKPQVVIDIATLTGACVIALGAVRSGLFANDDELAGQLAQAGEFALDPCWRMPLDDDYAEGLKSNCADMGNVAGRQAGAVTAAKFLQKFTAGLRWAHLDIAGVAWKSGASKGATGRPVPLLVQYLLDQAQAAAPAKVSGRPVRRSSRKA
jgi:leucyl aminopeptidase